MGPSFAKSRAVISFVVGLVFLAVGTGVTVSIDHTSVRLSHVQNWCFP